jgi:hypothetical protein
LHEQGFSGGRLDRIGKDKVTAVQEAYQIIGESRPGRWLVTCDHASNRVPDWVGAGSLGIAPEDMARHIAWDVGAAGLTRALAEALDSPAILSDFSRLVIDPNRGEDDPTLVMRLYDGTIIPTNRYLDAAGIEERLARLAKGLRAAHLADKVKVRPTSARWAWVEYMLAQGGRAEGLAVLEAVRNGGQFSAWKRAFENRPAVSHACTCASESSTPASGTRRSA